MDFSVGKRLQLPPAVSLRGDGARDAPSGGLLPQQQIDPPFQPRDYLAELVYPSDEYNRRLRDPAFSVLPHWVTAVVVTRFDVCEGHGVLEEFPKGALTDRELQRLGRCSFPDSTAIADAAGVSPLFAKRHLPRSACCEIRNPSQRWFAMRLRRESTLALDKSGLEAQTFLMGVAVFQAEKSTASSRGTSQRSLVVLSPLSFRYVHPFLLPFTTWVAEHYNVLGPVAIYEACTAVAAFWPLPKHARLLSDEEREGGALTAFLPSSSHALRLPFASQSSNGSAAAADALASHLSTFCNEAALARAVYLARRDIELAACTQVVNCSPTCLQTYLNTDSPDFDEPRQSALWRPTAVVKLWGLNRDESFFEPDISRSGDPIAGNDDEVESILSSLSSLARSDTNSTAPPPPNVSPENNGQLLKSYKEKRDLRRQRRKALTELYSTTAQAATTGKSVIRSQLRGLLLLQKKKRQPPDTATAGVEETKAALSSVPRQVVLEASLVISALGPLSCALLNMWVLAITQRSLVLLTSNATRSSGAVLAFLRLIRPLDYGGDVRPYVNAFDEDIQSYSESRSTFSDVGRAWLLGTSDPQLIRTMEKCCPNIGVVSCARSHFAPPPGAQLFLSFRETGAKHSWLTLSPDLTTPPISRPASLKNNVSPPSRSSILTVAAFNARKGAVHTNGGNPSNDDNSYRPWVPPPPDVQLRIEREFCELTLRFLAPFTPFFSWDTKKLMKQPLEEIEPPPTFNPKAFLGQVAAACGDSTSSLLVKPFSDAPRRQVVVELYQRFIGTQHFRTWFSSRFEQERRAARIAQLEYCAAVEPAKLIPSISLNAAVDGCALLNDLLPSHSLFVSAHTLSRVERLRKMLKAAVGEHLGAPAAIAATASCRCEEGSSAAAAESSASTDRSYISVGDTSV